MSNSADRQQLLRDPNIRPTDEVISAGLGPAHEAYKKFVKELAADHSITPMDWRFYNDGKAWLSKGEYKWTTPRGTNKVKPIFWLSMWDGFFKVSFFFSASLQDELQALPISPETRTVIQSANPMGQTMQFTAVILDIESEHQLSDAYTLAEFRKIRVR